MEKRQWNSPKVTELGVEETKKSTQHIIAVDATTYDSDGNYWDSRS